MNDHLVTRRDIEAVNRLTPTHQLIDTEIDKISRLEPLLFHEARLSALAIQSILTKAGISNEDLESVRCGIRQITARLFLGLRMGHYRVWLEGEQVAGMPITRKAHRLPKRREKRKPKIQK